MTFTCPAGPSCRICAHVDAWIADRNLTLRRPTPRPAQQLPPVVARIGSPERPPSRSVTPAGAGGPQ